MSTWGMIQSGRRSISEIESRLANERNTVERAHMLAEIEVLKRQVKEDLADERHRVWLEETDDRQSDRESDVDDGEEAA